MAARYRYTIVQGASLPVIARLSLKGGAPVNLVGALAEIEVQWVGGEWSDNSQSGNVTVDSDGYVSRRSACSPNRSDASAYHSITTGFRDECW